MHPAFLRPQMLRQQVEEIEAGGHGAAASREAEVQALRGELRLLRSAPPACTAALSQELAQELARREAAEARLGESERVASERRERTQAQIAMLVEEYEKTIEELGAQLRGRGNTRGATGGGSGEAGGGCEGGEAGGEVGGEVEGGEVEAGSETRRKLAIAEARGELQAEQLQQREAELRELKEEVRGLTEQMRTARRDSREAAGEAVARAALEVEQARTRAAQEELLALEQRHRATAMHEGQLRLRVSQLETDNEDLLEAVELQRGKLQRAEETLAREAQWLREHEAELQQLKEHEADLKDAGLSEEGLRELAAARASANDGGGGGTAERDEARRAAATAAAAVEEAAESAAAAAASAAAGWTALRENAALHVSLAERSAQAAEGERAAVAATERAVQAERQVAELVAQRTTEKATHTHVTAPQMSTLKQQLGPALEQLGKEASMLEQQGPAVQEKENARENVRTLCREPPPSPLAARV